MYDADVYTVSDERAATGDNKKPTFKSVHDIQLSTLNAGESLAYKVPQDIRENVYKIWNYDEGFGAKAET